MYIITLKTSENESTKYEVLSSSVVDPDRGKTDPDIDSTIRVIRVAEM